MKDAASFDLYPADWLAGTLLMSFEEKGLYLELLCLQWESGHLPPDEQLRRLRTKPAALAAVLAKFPVGEDGNRRNLRLETEREKQRERRARKSLGAAKTNAARWQTATAKQSLSNRLAIKERVAGESPPLTTDPVQERESSAGAPASERAHAARDIAGLYPRQDAPLVVLECILSDLEHGETVETLRSQVMACAEHIAKAPGGSGNRFVPSAKAFFTERQWRSPEAFAGRWQTDGAGGAGPKVKLTTKPEGGW